MQESHTWHASRIIQGALVPLPAFACVFDRPFVPHASFSFTRLPQGPLYHIESSLCPPPVVHFPCA